MARRKTLTLYERAAKSGWTYSGDMNLEHGGTFWYWAGDPDYVEAVRVTPCSDGGGPDNLFCIETGSIYFGSDDTGRRNAALECIGHDKNLIGPYQIDQLVYAHEAYHGIDPHVTYYVRIGKHEQGVGAESWNPEPDVILPANARLENYLFREYLA